MLKKCIVLVRLYVFVYICDETLPCVYQALARTLSGVVNKISNIIPISSDVASSAALSSTSKQHTADTAAADDDDDWTDEDSLVLNVTVSSAEVMRCRR